MRLILALVGFVALVAAAWLMIDGEGPTEPLVENGDPATIAEASRPEQPAIAERQVSEAAPTKVAAREVVAGHGTLVGGVVALVGDPVAATIEVFEVGESFHPDRLRFGHGDPGRVADAISDGDGRFSVALPHGRRYALRVTADGYAAALRGAFAVWDGKITDTGPVELTPESRVSGRVVDAVTGAAVIDADVTLIHPLGQFFSASDADGMFQFRRLSAGSARVMVAAKGYVDRNFRDALELRLEDGSHVADVRLELTRDGTIVGLVVDERRTPIVGMWVRAVDLNDDAEQRSGQTDSEGRFEIEELWPGVAYRLLTYGTEFHPAEARATAGGAPVDIVMRRLPTIEVRALDAVTGAAIENARGIAAGGESRAAFGFTAAEPDGRMRVPYREAGEHRVHVHAHGYASASSNPIVTDGESGYGPIEVRMRPLELEAHDRFHLRVVRVPDGEPITGAVVSTIDGRGMRRVIHGVLTDALVVRELGRTDGEGWFSASRQSGVRLRVTAPGYSGVEIEPTGVTTSDAPHVVPLDPGGVIVGTVTGLDGHPAGDAAVIALRAGGGAKTVRTQPDGVYRLTGLAPGPWSVTVGNIYEKPESSRKVVDHASPVPPPSVAARVASDEEIVVDLDMRQLGASLRGHVRVDGEGRISMRVLLRDDPDAPMPSAMRTAWTGPKGDYAFVGLLPGRYELAVTGPSGNTPLVRRPVTLVASQSMQVDLEAWTGDLVGQVLDPAGAPVDGARIKVHDAGGRTDHDGRFSLHGLPEGPAVVLASAAQLGTLVARIAVVRGRETEARLRFATPGRLVITVTGELEPGARGSLALTRVDGIQVPVHGLVKPDADGSFAAMVAPGDYSVSVRFFGQGGRTESTPASVPPGGETEVALELVTGSDP